MAMTTTWVLGVWAGSKPGLSFVERRLPPEGGGQGVAGRGGARLLDLHAHLGGPPRRMPPADPRAGRRRSCRRLSQSPTGGFEKRDPTIKSPNITLSHYLSHFKSEMFSGSPFSDPPLGAGEAQLHLTALPQAVTKTSLAENPHGSESRVKRFGNLRRCT